MSKWGEDLVADVFDNVRFMGVIREGTYRSRGVEAYITGGSVQTNWIEIPVEYVRARWTGSQITTDLRGTESELWKFLIPFAQLIDANSAPVTPRPDDEMVGDDAKTYRVGDYRLDPASGLYVVQMAH